MIQVLVFGLLAAASANVIHEGSCPDMKPVENFNLTAYQGLWYGVSKTPNQAEKEGKCATTEYTMNGEEVKVKNTHVADGVQMFIQGNGKFAPDANKSGKLVLDFKVGDQSQVQPLSVVSTDYSNYAIAYNCKYDEKNKTHSDSAWILSRNKKLEGDAKSAVDKFLKDHAKTVDPTKLVETDFSDDACKFTSTSDMSTAQIKQ